MCDWRLSSLHVLRRGSQHRNSDSLRPDRTEDFQDSNPMKKLNFIALTVIAVCLVIPGCEKGAVNDQLIINGVSVATSTGLSVIKDANQKHMIANLLQGYAPGLRTITSNPTPAQLAALIDQYTPSDIKANYPQAVAFATPLVINAVNTAIAHYGDKTKSVVQIVNDVATGLELGSSGS